MPVDLADGLDDPAPQLGPGCVAREGDRHRHDGGAAVDRDALHHAELDDRSPQLGLLDGSQRGLDVQWFGHVSGPWLSASGLLRISTTRVGRIRPMAADALTADEFNSVVSAVTNAFGDPTRREIYLFARDAGATGVTAGAVAEHFELHPNVARHHLEKLTGGGYLMVEVGKAVQGKAVTAPPAPRGVPSKRYLAGPLDSTLALPLKHDDLLGGLLARALDALGPGQAEVLADEVGFEYGTTLAARAWTPPRGTVRCAPRSPRWPTRSPPTGSRRTPSRTTAG